MTRGESMGRGEGVTVTEEDGEANRLPPRVIMVLVVLADWYEELLGLS